MAFSRLNAQTDCDFVSLGSSLKCGKATVALAATIPNLPAHHWDFGDGTPVLVGGSDLEFVEHDYLPNINPFSTPTPKIRHSIDGVNWCENDLSQLLSGILVGSGCGSLNTVSNLIANQKLPAGELVGKTLYVFGNLEVDIPYNFNGCTILVSESGEISVKSGGVLTLTNNTMADAFIDPGSSSCQGLWNGIKVFPGGTLITNVASIRNAYYAVSPINPGNITPFPKLSLRNTTFQRNFVGIYAAEGPFAVSLFMNNTFQGAGNTAIYTANTCSPQPQIPGVPFSRRTYCGVYFDGSMGGSLLLAGQSTNNLIKDMQAGIVCINGTSRVTGCRFENIAFLTAAPALYQGTALTFIDNIGGKRLVFTGLGKESPLATITNCERGVYVNTTKPLTEAFVSSCRMLEVQNGVEMEETEAGNFAKGWVNNCYISCTKYLPNIKMRSTGIEIKDPNIIYSNFNTSWNDIDVDLGSLSDPMAVLPTGIHLAAMHNQASNSAMLLNISNNQIKVLSGINGITVENVVNGNISGNTVMITAIFPDQFRAIGVAGGTANVITCNILSAAPQGNIGIYGGVVCEASTNISIDRNTITDLTTGIAFRFDSETSCFVSNNDIFQVATTNAAGITYKDAQTGPQYLQGNDWFGDFFAGALYHQDPASFTYCNSFYNVSPEANVANVINPALISNVTPPQNCDNIPGDDAWFTVLEVPEGDYSCGGSTAGGAAYKNEADLNLAGGGTLVLSPGYRWSSEMGLYRKFTENPDLAIGDAVIAGFLQAKQGQPVAAMYGVRNRANDIEGSISPALLSNIQNTLLQLEANEVGLLVLLQSIDTDTNALASFTTLITQAEVLEQTLQNYMASALSSMAQYATSVQNSNNSISCSTLPCTAERYINGLYLETQVISHRSLTASEFEAVRQIGLNCPNDAGSIVYLARSWYYLQTGVSLDPPCGSFMPPLSGGDRNSQPKAESAIDLVLIPNPADDNLEVRIPANLKESTLLITDIWGRLLLHRKVPECESTSTLTISTDGFANGIYLVSIKEKTGKPSRKKLIITH